MSFHSKTTILRSICNSASELKIFTYHFKKKTNKLFIACEENSRKLKTLFDERIIYFYPIVIYFLVT